MRRVRLKEDITGIKYKEDSYEYDCVPLLKGMTGIEIESNIGITIQMDNGAEFRVLGDTFGLESPSEEFERLFEIINENE